MGSSTHMYGEPTPLPNLRPCSSPNTPWEGTCCSSRNSNVLLKNVYKQAGWTDEIYLPALLVGHAAVHASPCDDLMYEDGHSTHF